MLYQIGPLTLEPMPFSVDGLSHTVGADLAAKDVMGGRKPREFMGEADETISLSGQLLPIKLGGLTELETAQSLSSSGTKVPVMRGDGKMLGWYAIEKVGAQHVDLTRYGVGFVIRYTMDLVRDTDEAGAAGGGDQAGGLVGMLLSLFEAL